MIMMTRPGLGPFKLGTRSIKHGHGRELELGTSSNHLLKGAQDKWWEDATGSAGGWSWNFKFKLKVITASGRLANAPDSESLLLPEQLRQSSVGCGGQGASKLASLQCVED
jgi:hypothetical protein